MVKVLKIKDWLNQKDFISVDLVKCQIYGGLTQFIDEDFSIAMDALKEKIEDMLSMEYHLNSKNDD